MTLLVKIFIGIALLILGRKMFWLMVGGVGFLAGSFLSTMIMPDATEWVSLVFALVVGVVGILLAKFVQKVGISIAGFVIGGMAASGLLAGFLPDIPGWIFFVIGGIVGIILTFAVFEWSLILISSFTGAYMITDAFTLESMLNLLFLLGLFLVGVVVQFRMKSKEN